MKKKLIGLAAMAAIMTLSAGITAFAGWELDETGQYMYRGSNGNFVYAGWVTDPDTGYEYYMDPDGHIMRGTTVEGYWLDDDGVKHEKSEAQLAAEERRAAREAAYNTPGKEVSATNDIAQEAKSSGVALTTTRRNYQAEMYTISNQAFDYIKKGLEADNIKSLKGATSKTNLTNKFYYYNRDYAEILYSDMPKAVAGSNAYYDYALDICYNFNVMHDESVPYLNEGFRRLLVGALGEEQGELVYQQIVSTGVDESYDYTGYTATGNSYRVRCVNCSVHVYVTCSEIVLPTEEELAAALAEAEAEAFAEDFAVEADTESIIVAGQGEAQLEEEAAETAYEEAYEEAYAEAYAEDYEVEDDYALEDLDEEYEEEEYEEDEYEEDEE